MSVDGDVASAVGGFVGDLGGAVLGGAFNARSARKQMQFQERMANTQYQRAAADIEAAGLNRVLALGNPAHSPSGASAAMNAPALGSAVNNARVANAQTKNLQEQANLTAVTAMTTAADGELKNAQREESEARRLNILEDTLLKRGQIPWYNAMTGNVNANTAKVADEREKIQQEIVNLKESIPMLRAQGKKMEADAAQAEVQKLMWKVLQPIAETGGKWVADTLEKQVKNAQQGASGGSVISPIRGWMLDHMTKKYRLQLQTEQINRNRKK